MIISPDEERSQSELVLWLNSVYFITDMSLPCMAAFDSHLTQKRKEPINSKIKSIGFATNLL